MTWPDPPIKNPSQGPLTKTAAVYMIVGSVIFCALVWYLYVGVYS